MEGELHNESNFYDVQLLTTHTLSAKGPTQNCDLSICFGRASFVDRSKNRRKNNVIMKVFVWLLQRVTEMVVNSLVSIIFNAIASCFTETWNSTKMDNILRVGNSLYSYIRLSIKEGLLLLSEIPSALCLDEETYRLSYSESITGDVNMLESRDCYFSLLEALRSLRRRCNACLLTIFCNTVAIFFAEDKIV